MKVIIIGAGLGGLLLAQGLLKGGHDPQVFERDAAPDFRHQGYRVTLWNEGIAALASAAPQVIENFEAESAAWAGMADLDTQLNVKWEGGSRPGRTARSVDRLTLRRILLDGLEGRVHFGKPFVRFEEAADHVEAVFEDGSTVRGDLLVGADGARSRVRGQLLPEQADLADTGKLDLAGKAFSTDEVLAAVALLKPAERNIMIVADGRGDAMVIIPQWFGRNGERDARDYIYWGLISDSDRFGPAGADSAALKAAAEDITAGWHPAIRDLVRLTDPQNVNLIPMRTSTPHGPWKTGRVTLLGDAVHSMVPFRGQGANMALQDGALLAERLSSDQGLIEAVGGYEQSMLISGFGAVTASLAALHDLCERGGTPFTAGARR